jgi:hypothetical protein
MTFYSLRKPDENRLIIAMNPLLRGILVFIFLSLLFTFVFNMSVEEMTNASTAGKISIIVTPLFFFLGSCYRYSVSFDKTDESCLIRKGVFFLYKTQRFSFSDLTGLNYRIYDYQKSEEGNQFIRGIPRRSQADFGFFFRGKLLQLEKAAPKKEVDVLYFGFITYFPRTLHNQ